MNTQFRPLHAEEARLLPRLFSYNDPDEMLRITKQRLETGEIEIHALFMDSVLQGELRVSFDTVTSGTPAAIPGKRVYLYAFRIHKDVQGHGWGQRLLKHVLDDLRRRGYREFTIGVEDDNPLARHIYTKLGFTEVLARCAETYQGDSYEYDLLLRRDDQNIFDDPTFFDGYRKLRENPTSANEVVEKPTLFALSPDLAGKRVLDMGCGCGENCREFARMGAAEVVGIDISEKMLAVAEAENNCGNVRFQRLSMTDLSALSGKFDVIFSSLAIHYVEDLSALLQDAADHLNEGGYLIFSQEHPLTTAKLEEVYWEKDADGKALCYRLTGYGIPGERQVHWFVDGVRKYHRTFSDILNALVGAGFTLEEMREPLPPPEIIEMLPKYGQCLHKPDFLFIKARKL